jgi:predicted ester cyclase
MGDGVRLLRLVGRFAAQPASPRRPGRAGPVPGNRCTINVAVAEGNEAVQESVFTGTHTETFHVPGSPDIPATGKSVAIPYTLGLTYLNGKWSSFRLLFDRAELMTQLGLMPA